MPIKHRPCSGSTYEPWVGCRRLQADIEFWCYPFALARGMLDPHPDPGRMYSTTFRVDLVLKSNNSMD